VAKRPKADEPRPVHIIDEAGDRKSRCGIKDALPRVLARFVEAHREGHARTGRTFFVCEECERAAPCCT
jgi:hypothetical protein